VRRGANNRPIRTRPPGRRRPVRWIDAFSANSVSNDGTVTAGSIGPSVASSTQWYRELVVGDIDTEWADANEVVVERLVGSVGLACGSVLEATLPYAASNRLLPICRLGLLVVEDVDEGAAFSPPSLWQTDDIQDGEWMWLHQVRAWDKPHIIWDGADVWMLAHHDIRIDLRVKRKLGRRDKLVLCHDFRYVGNMPSLATVDVQPYLRCLVSTK